MIMGIGSGFMKELNRKMSFVDPYSDRKWKVDKSLKELIISPKSENWNKKKEYSSCKDEKKKYQKSTGIAFCTIIQKRKK